MNSPRQGIKDIPSICSQLGMKYVVITPGSRNAPLIISFNQEKTITCLSITDERSAGYFALGIAQTTGAPVGLVCTSGTAALNFGPAIAEAYYQNLPLIVFTADRPPELIDQADGQTIRQSEVFKNYVKKSYTLPTETAEEADLLYSNRLISEAIGMALQTPSGPVHINVPLREPLYTKLPALSTNTGIIKTTTTQIDIPANEFDILLSKWNDFEKKMIVVGFGSPDDSLLNVLVKLSKDKSVIIIAENLSNLCNDRFIYSPERFFAALCEEEKVNFRPDLLITFGNSVVSKKLKQFLSAYRPTEHWYLATWPTFSDTFQSLTLNVMIHPEHFFEKILSGKKSSDSGIDFSGLFSEKEQKIQVKHDEFLAQLPFSDIKAFEQILNTLPSKTNLHLANSTPVRYAQLFKTRHDIQYYGNRGTSGIDGCISTAAGSAFASGQSTTIIAGDLAFIYDSNALWNNYLSENLKIIVINNGGGNIFTLIDTSPEISALTNFFETPHKVNISHLTAAFGVKYYFCDDIVSMKEQLVKLFVLPGPAVLEIKTDAETSTKVYKQYFRQIKL